MDDLANKVINNEYVDETLNELCERVRAEPGNRKSPYVFICYSRANADVVYTDVLRFRELGYNIWLDESNMDRTKKRYPDDTLPSITTPFCKLILFYLSKESIQSEPAYKELMTAEGQTARDHHDGNAVPFLVIDVNKDVYDMNVLRKSVIGELEEALQSDNSDYYNINKKIDTVNSFFKDIFPDGNKRSKIRPKDYKKRYDNYDQYINDIIREGCFKECRKNQQNDSLFSLGSERIVIVDHLLDDNLKIIDQTALKVVDLGNEINKPIDLADGNYRGALKDGLPHGQGTYWYESGATYKGGFYEGKKEGEGVFTFENGDKYEGVFHNDMPHGRGVKTCIQDGCIQSGEFRHGKLQGYGEITYSNSAKRIIGHFLNGVLNGDGEIINEDGSRSKGQYKDGALDGWGQLLLPDGSLVAEGDFVKGRYNGHAKIIINGYVFEGEFINDKKNGHGKVIYANGDVFEGEFKDGLPNGAGKFTGVKGFSYEGQYKNGKPNGIGIKRSENGDIYDGEFKSGLKDGHGKTIFSNGDVFEGEYKNDKANGHGTMKYSNGDLFDGEFMDGEREGKGVLYYSNGDILKGYFKLGRANGYCEKVKVNGYCFKGIYKDGEFNGRGKEIWPHGAIYEGDFVDGTWNGVGRLESFNQIYEGSFSNGRLEGHGKITYANGDICEGEFINGKLVGQGKWIYACKDNGKKKIDDKNYTKEKVCSNNKKKTAITNESSKAKITTEAFDSSITGAHNEDLIKKYESIIKEGLCSPHGSNKRTNRETILFGKFNSYPRGKRPIEWIVLKDDGDRKLIITKKIIDVKDFNMNIIGSSWADTRIRKWLNGVFLNDAFSVEERNKILYTYHDNIVTVYESSNGNLLNEKHDYNSAERIVLLSKEERQKSFDKYANIAESHKSDDCPFFPFGKKTYCDSIVSDRVFLLSSFEARVYFDGNVDRKTTDTVYVRNRQLFSSSRNEWWLRDINYMCLTGDIPYCNINRCGSVSKERSDSRRKGVRPAMWIK